MHCSSDFFIILEPYYLFCLWISTSSHSCVVYSTFTFQTLIKPFHDTAIKLFSHILKFIFEFMGAISFTCGMESIRNHSNTLDKIVHINGIMSPQIGSTKRCLNRLFWHFIQYTRDQQQQKIEKTDRYGMKMTNKGYGNETKAATMKHKNHTHIHI